MRERPTRRLCIGAIAGILALAVLAGPACADGLVDLLKVPGNIAFMRHANAPIVAGQRETGMRAETLGPCSVQRNLDDTGRGDARRIGELFRREGVVFEHVFTSRWCRCRDTAELVIGRPVDHLPLIDSYFTDPDATIKPAQILALKTYLNQQLARGDRTLMVTHGSVITDLAGIDTGETEIVIVRADGHGGVVVVGRGVP